MMEGAAFWPAKRRLRQIVPAEALRHGATAAALRAGPAVAGGRR